MTLWEVLHSGKKKTLYELDEETMKIVMELEKEELKIGCPLSD